MAVVYLSHHTRAIQYTGTGSVTEMQSELDAWAAVALGSGSNLILTITDATSTTWRVKTEELNPPGPSIINYEDHAVNDFMVLDRNTSGPFVCTAAQMAAKYRSYSQIMTMLAATPEFAAGVTAGTARSFTNNAARSPTTGTGATGFQVSATRDALVGYNITTSTTATIGGASTVTAVLEIAPTNSATPGDWREICRMSNGQTITLAIALQSVQTYAGQLSGVVPAGYYAKIRTITTGTGSAQYNTGQEVLL